MNIIEFQATIENGHIKIPEEYQAKIASNVHVVIINDNEQSNENFIDYLLTHPIQLKNFSPLTREEIHAR